MPLVQPDQTGGLRSFPAALTDTLTKGLEYIVAGELGKRYGFSFGADDRKAVNTEGETKPAAAPSPDPKVTDQAAFALGNPLIAAAAIAAAIALVVALVRR